MVAGGSKAKSLFFGGAFVGNIKCLEKDDAVYLAEKYFDLFMDTME